MNYFNRLFCVITACTSLLVYGPDYSTNLTEDFIKTQIALKEVQESKNFADYQLTCQNQKLAHILLFSETEKKGLEKRNNELAKKNYLSEQITREKNNQISLLFDEIQTIRKSLYQSLSTRNNLDKAYLELDQKFQLLQHNYSAQVKSLQSKVIASEVARQCSVMSEGQALQEAAILEQALKDNESFYNKEIYTIFNDLSKDLENTKQQLTLATDACYETQTELDAVKEQLTIAQKILSKQGLTPQNEKELKALQQAVNRVAKQATGNKNSHHQKLAESLKKIQSLDQKLEKAHQIIAQNQTELKTKAARELSSAQELKTMNAELLRVKKEYQATLAQNALSSNRTIKHLLSDLSSSKEQNTRSQKILAAKDLAFSTLEKHCANIKNALSREELAQKALLAELSTKNTQEKQLVAKVEQLQSSQINLRSLASKAQKELADKTIESQQLGFKLKVTSKKLAENVLRLDDLSTKLSDITKSQNELAVKVDAQESEISILTLERNNYMNERHQFANLANKLYNDRSIVTSRLNTVIETVAKAHEHSQYQTNLTA
jgi:hypothetical protein